LPNALEWNLRCSSPLRHFAECRIADRVGDGPCIVRQLGRVSLAVGKQVVGLTVPVLADHVAVQVRLGRVFGNCVPCIVELPDDVVVNRIPEVIDRYHGQLSFLTRRQSAV
jgi:hypothetical protein